MFCKDRKGFTIYELAFVLAIVAILFVVLVPRLGKVGDRANESGVKTDFNSFKNGIQQVMLERSGLPGPDNATAISAINDVLDTELELDETNKSVKLDPWNEPYRYEIVGTVGSANHAILIKSYGKSNAGNSSINVNEKTVTATASGGPDYILVIEYESGQISVCTAGLSNNIGSYNPAGTFSTGGFCN